MKILVCGPRDYEREGDVILVMKALVREFGLFDLIVGGARGVDEYALKEAKYLKLSHRIFYANWLKYGPSAGPIRNKEMIEMVPDLVVAFKRDDDPGFTRGTNSTVNLAIERGIRIRRYRFLQREGVLVCDESTDGERWGWEDERLAVFLTSLTSEYLQPSTQIATRAIFSVDNPPVREGL